MCDWCNEPLYRKMVQYTMPLAAPATHVDELRHELLNLTGEVYAPILKQYCAVCGEKTGRG